MKDELAPSLRLPAATSGNAPLTYALSPAPPAGLAFDAATRIISGTPTAVATAADYTLTATDADGQTATLTFMLEVLSEADSAPLLPVDSALPDRVWTKDVQIAPITLPAATGGDGALTYALTPNLPAGLTFNAAMRTISGTPTVASSRQIYTYSVTDADSNTAEQRWRPAPLCAVGVGPAGLSGDAIEVAGGHGDARPAAGHHRLLRHADLHPDRHPARGAQPRRRHRHHRRHTARARSKRAPVPSP